MVHKFPENARLTLEVGETKMEATYDASKNEWMVSTKLPSGRSRGARVWTKGAGEELQSLANKVGEYIFTHRDCFPCFDAGGNEKDKERIGTQARLFGVERVLIPVNEGELPEQVPYYVFKGDEIQKLFLSLEEAKKYAKEHGGVIMHEEEYNGIG